MTHAAAPDVEPTTVRDRLREDILACRLMPEARLKFGDLQERYEASIGTLREALMELVADGLVLVEPNRGFSVAPVSVKDLLDITELRVDLECKALTGAIQSGDDDWEARVLGAFHLLQKAEVTVKANRDAAAPSWSQRHQAFHESLVSACPSRWVLRFRQTLFDQARRYRALSMKHSATPGRMEQHRQLMDFVLARDVDKACRVAEAHIRDTARNILEAMPGYGAVAEPAPTKALARRRKA